jgi:hypothetical protein
MSFQKKSTDYRTNLAIIGEGIRDYDLRRIAACE